MPRIPGKERPGSRTPSFVLVATLAIVCLIATAGPAAAETPTIAAGGGTTCVVTVAGAVNCWGDNTGGKLGSGGTTDSPVPAPVPGLPTAARSVAVGDTHSCAVLVTDQVACWGSNAQGMLGAGDTGVHATPVIVSGIGPARAVAAGWRHTCALIADGTVWCWGYNIQGELGDGSGAMRSAPVQAVGIAGATSIDAAGKHTCAVVAGGGVSCWGLNEYGEIGAGHAAGPASFSTTPVAVPGVGDAAELALGEFFSCARLVDGTVQCWGGGWAGQRGDGSTPAGPVPTPSAVLLAGAQYISAGGAQICAVVTGGGLLCWGNNSSGQLGVDDLVDRSIPAVTIAGGVSGVAAGDKHTCALATNGVVSCFGSNEDGQMGSGDSADKDAPTAVTLSGPTAIATGGDSSCAVVSGGAVRCWGKNDYDQFLTGGTANVVSPTVIPGLTGVTDVAVGSRNVCVIVGTTQLKCWGYNGWGAVGAGDGSGGVFPAHPTPTTVPLGTGIEPRQVVIGGDFGCVRTNFGAVMCWGYNLNGRLGDNTTTHRDTPTVVSGLGLGSNVVEIAAGFAHACARTSVGAVRCWGSDHNGQIGDGPLTTDDALTPKTVATSGYSHIAAGKDFTCGSLTAGGIRCWGNNSFGQLGLGTSSGEFDVPQNVIGSGATMNVEKLRSGDSRTCAVSTGLAAWCWGYNHYGELGPTSAPGGYLQPRQITLPNPVKQADSGNFHTCLLDSSPRVYCLGFNASGQLGIGVSPVETQPRTVAGLAPVAQPPATVLRARPTSPSPTPATPRPPRILSAPTSGRITKSLRLRVFCPVGCQLELRVKIGGRTYAMRSVKVKPTTAKTIKVKLPRALARKARRALRKNRRTRVTLYAQPFAGSYARKQTTKLKRSSKLPASTRVRARCASPLGCELHAKLTIGNRSWTLAPVKLKSTGGATRTVTVRYPKATRSAAGQQLKRGSRASLTVRTHRDAQRGGTRRVRLR